MSVWREVFFHQQLDAANQFPPCEVEELPRGILPLLHESTDILLRDRIWVMIWQLAGYGTDKQEVKARDGQRTTKHAPYEFAFFNTSSTKIGEET